MFVISPNTHIAATLFNYEFLITDYFADDGTYTYKAYSLTRSGTTITYNPLPTWLTFDSTVSSLSGTPTLSDYSIFPVNLEIVLEGTDSSGNLLLSDIGYLTIVNTLPYTNSIV